MYNILYIINYTINVEGELLLRGALLARVSDSNSSLSDLYTSMNDDFSIINVYLQQQFRRQRHYQLN